MELLLVQSFDHEVAIERAHAFQVAGRHLGEPARPGRDIGQPTKSKHSLDHRVIAIEVALAQSSVSEQQMDDQHHHQVLRSVRHGPSIRHRVREPLLEPQSLEQRLEDHETRVRCEPLILESKLGDRVDRCDDLWSAQSHGSGPLRVVEVVVANFFYTTKRPYFYASRRRGIENRRGLGFAERSSTLQTWAELCNWRVYSICSRLDVNRIAQL
jgi:hypothetical protein